MAKEICISSTPHETRLAILEDDQLAEIYYERENEYTLAGSIYNGRVTRVLPGMQSAFVDLGLERDAFLYVTDFMELEDEEDTEELERAAASGANLPPREVRHTNGARLEGRSPDAGHKAERRHEPHHDRAVTSQRPMEEAELQAETTELAALAATSAPEEAEGAQETSDAAGSRRWRGRRRRRGTRGPAVAAEGLAETQRAELEGEEAATATEAGADLQASAEAAAEPGPHGAASASWAEKHDSKSVMGVSAPARRAAQSPTPFFLPGESLAKYGGVPEDESAKAAQKASAPVRPISTSKPSTLIDAPIHWDGSGLLPGESLSGRRLRQPEPEISSVSSLETAPEPEVPLAETMEAGVGEEASESAETFEETEELAPQADVALAAEASQEPSTQAEQEQPAEEASAFASEAGVETETGAAAGLGTPQGSSADPQTASATAEETKAFTPAESETEADSHTISIASENEEEPAAGASASHRVDPAAPTGFRLFGLGGKRKKEREEEEVVETPAGKPQAAVAISAFSPGNGLVEEEVIEEEESEAVAHPQRSSKTDERDLDDYEEETLSTQIRSGDLGEMLQEAHLDHRIQLNFDEKNGEEEETFEGEEGEEPSGEAQPAPGQARRERSGRGRRGRGGRTGPGQGQAARRGPSRRSMQATDLPVISDLLKPGQEILVQIAKEPIAKKGARITSHIALPGRFLVFMPTVTHVGVSRKIASDEERQRLKRILINERGDASGGFIVRTAAEGASEEELRADLRFLIRLWNDIKQRSESSKSPALIYHDLSLIERILRDQVSADFSNIWVDSEADYERIVRFLNRFSPSLVRRVKLYTKETPLFEHFGIQDEISKALRSKVWLKSGGSIVINQTEALVAIDINTGKYVGKSARLEDTIVKTNLDAVPEIVRQIRLRDLGGIIIIDFIDMDERKNRFKVMAALEEALKSDRAPTKVLQFNDFGLVAITRKRVKQSLERTLSVPCPICQATGMVKSSTTVCNEIYIELRKMRRHFEGADVLLRVHPETVKVLKNNNGRWLTEFEELIGRNVLLKSDPTLHPEQFDIQG